MGVGMVRTMQVDSLVQVNNFSKSSGKEYYIMPNHVECRNMC